MQKTRKRAWQPTPVFLLGKSHGQSSLAGLYSMGLQRVKHDWATITFFSHPGLWTDAFIFFNNFIYYYYYFLLCWVFFAVCRLSLVAGRKGYSIVAVQGLLTGGFSLLWSTGSRHMGPVAAAHRPSRSTACGILLRTWTRTCVPWIGRWIFNH